MNNKPAKNLCIPQRLLSDMFEIYKKCEEFSDEFEDVVLASDEEFINKIRESRKEHLNGKLKRLDQLKQELN